MPTSTSGATSRWSGIARACSWTAYGTSAAGGGSVENTGVLVAIGVGTDGRREVLAVAEGMKEDAESRREFITGIIARGLKGVGLVTTGARDLWPR